MYLQFLELVTGLEDKAVLLVCVFGIYESTFVGVRDQCCVNEA